MDVTFRADGFGTNVIENNGGWKIVWICPYCGTNKCYGAFASKSEAVEVLEGDILHHKESGSCTFDWRAWRIQRSQEEKDRRDAGMA